MKLTVHDVGHGSCISLVHENGNVMLWDCGHSDDNRPSVFLPEMGIETIHNLYITNFDQDHISDLINLAERVDIQTFTRNRTISSGQLEKLKIEESGFVTDALEAILNLNDTYTGAVTDLPAFPRVECRIYYNHYPEFMDTNNLSLVTFVTCDATTFLIPGDIEKDGWATLLTNPNFQHDLGLVDIFIASHHGREKGYFPEVFNYCTDVQAFVFSDSAIKYATQEMTDTYATHANGMPLNGNTRKVLTTRRDGDISWDL